MSEISTPAPAAGARAGKHSVLKSAGIMSIAIFISRITGLIRSQVFAFIFGAGNAMDAFNVAFRIPNLLRDLFAEGAMSASLVPTFTRTRVEEGDRRAWRVAGLVFRILFLVVSVLTLIGMVAAPHLVDLYAGAFHRIPGKYELTVRMTRMIFPYFPIVALAAAFMGVLNACDVFFLPALSAALFNIGSVVVGVVIAHFLFRAGPRWGLQPIEGMAMGVVAGGALAAIVQLPILYKKGYRWQKRQPEDPVWFRDPRLKTMLLMMIPGTIGLAATQVNILVNTMLATSLNPGAVSWLNYAFRLMQFPIGIFGVSLASATLPRVSAQWVQNDLEGARETLVRSLRHVFAVNLPASAGLAFLGYPIIQMIFQYGRFYPEDARATALALAMYAIGLTAYSAVKVLVPGCYALGNTRIPVISSAIAVAVTIVLNLLMVKPFGYWGLALGTSIAAIVNALYLLGSIRLLIEKAGGKFPIMPLLRAFLEHLAVALAMGVVCYFSYQGIAHLLPDMLFLRAFGVVMGRISLPFVRAAKVGVVILLGVGMVVALARVFKLEDTNEAVDLFAGKIKKKLSRRPT